MDFLIFQFPFVDNSYLLLDFPNLCHIHTVRPNTRYFSEQAAGVLGMEHPHTGKR